MSDKRKPTRRDILKGAAYVTPAILTLVASPSYAKKGSEGKKKKNDWDDDWD